MHNSAPFCHRHKISLQKGDNIAASHSSSHKRRTGHTSYTLSGITDFIYSTDWYETNTTLKHLQFIPEHAYTLFQKISNKQGTLSPIYNKVYQGDMSQ